MRKLILIFLLFLLFLPVLTGQVIGGGEIYYELLSSNKYKVTANVYRQCSGAPLKKLDGYVVSDSFKVSINFKRISIAKVNDTCGNPCQNLNDSSNEGFEKHTYIDTVDFNKSPYNKFVIANNCEVYFVIHQNLRPVTTTLSKSNSNTMFYLDAMVNLCQNLKSNHSPQFTFDPKLFAKCNQSYIYNMGFIDTFDYDSIGLTLDVPLKDFKSPVSYSGSFSSTIPMSPFCPPNPGTINCRPLPDAKPPRGFYFDKIRGDIIFTPVKCDETGVIKVTASEYRKDSSNHTILIGRTSREMIVSVKMDYTDNNTPYFGGNNTFNICENKTICFNIATFDDPFLPYQTIPDTVRTFWNNGIPSASLEIVDSTAREKTLNFCWKSKNKPEGFNNRFAVQAYDIKCMMNMSSKGYVVYKNPSIHIKLSSFAKCNIIHYSIINTDSINNSNSNMVYQVNLKSVNSPTQIIKQSTKNKDSFEVLYSGRYIIEILANNKSFNCPLYNYDTIDIKDLQLNIANSNDTFFCQNDSEILSPQPALKSKVKYYWYDSFIGNGIVDSSDKYSFKNLGKSRTIKLQTIGENGCLLSDQVKVYSRGAAERSPDEALIYLCEKTKNSFSISKLYGTPPFSINWYLDNSHFGSDSSLNFTIFKSAQLKLAVTDSANCEYTDTSTLIAVKKPVIGMNDTTICLNSFARIPSNVSGLGNMKYYWTLDNKLDSQKNSYFNLIVKGTYILNLKAVSASQCESQKNILISYYNLPQFSILSDTVFNKADFIKMDLSDSFSSYMWSNGASTKKNDFWAYTLGNPGKYTLWCEVTDSNGCKSRETIKIRTNGRTAIEGLYKNGYLIYPNPVQDQLNIETASDGTFEIINSNGQTVLKGYIHEGVNAIDLKGLASGVYLLRIGEVEFRVIR